MCMEDLKERFRKKWEELDKWKVEKVWNIVTGPPEEFDAGMTQIAEALVEKTLAIKSWYERELESMNK